MKIELNGRPAETDEGRTVAALLRDRGLLRPSAIVALNLRVLARSSWEDTVLADGDSLEVFSFVTGG